MGRSIRKKKACFFLGGVLLILFTMTSCLHDTEIKYLGDQITLLNRRVAELEGVEKHREPQLQSIQNKQADTGVEIDQLKRAVQSMTGRVEDSELILGRAVERDLNARETAEAQINELIKRVDRLEILVKLHHQYLNLEEPVLKDEETEKAEPAPSDGEETEPAGPAVLKPEEENELYNYSLTAFRENQYEKSMDGFSEFLKAYPKSDLADNAQFWIGESYMALKQYEQAILSYQKVIKDYPKGNKVPSAMLRQAIAFLEINDRTSARLLLQRIIKNYPNSSEAVVAKKRLGTIKP